MGQEFLEMRLNIAAMTFNPWSLPMAETQSKILKLLFMARCIKRLETTIVVNKNLDKRTAQTALPRSQADIDPTVS